jgi:hypothetical protein
MSTIILLSLLVCLAGLVLFVLLSDRPLRPAFRRVAEIMFAAGLLAFLLSGVSLNSCSVVNGPPVHAK